jgi:hypothetical protein
VTPAPPANALHGLHLVFAHSRRWLPSLVSPNT